MSILNRRTMLNLLASGAATLLSGGLSVPRSQARPGNGGLMFIVAHPDDDLLLINPDVQGAILRARADPEVTVTTIYITSGVKPKEGPQGREGGVMAAYAYMADSAVDTPWDMTIKWRLPYRELRSYPNIRLLFMRLPAQNEEGSDNYNDLGKLWEGQQQTLEAIDGTAIYTKTSLVEKLFSLINDLGTTTVGILDPTAKNFKTKITGRKFCSWNCQGKPGLNCDTYPYDHYDHYYSALFALEACKTITLELGLASYRTYNILQEPENVSLSEGTRKLNTAGVYAKIADGLRICDKEYWVRRRYLRYGPLPLSQMRISDGQVRALLDSFDGDALGMWRTAGRVRSAWARSSSARMARS